MTELELLLDLHVQNDRQGPGGDAETLRALEFSGLRHIKGLRVADIGCGTGASALLLAETLKTHITAIDLAEPFIHRLRARASERGLEEFVEARVGSMESLPFKDHELDLAWSEGAIYNMGFERGIRAWRQLLRPGGVLAVSELSWKTASRPHDLEAHWRREYPGITTASENLRMLEHAGYEPLGFFFLPDHCWMENYYEPIRLGAEAFRNRHRNGPAAAELIRAEGAERALYVEHGRYYGYGFYIARAPGSAG
ncbi:MAG: methyltransferase domain-containing protein [Planctomycetota bacterium]